MAMKRFGFVIFVALVMLINGCGQKQLVKKDLLGSYHVKWQPYPGRYLGNEKLTLGQNGTFEQSFIEPSGKVRHNVGSWEWVTGSSTICLRDAKGFVTVFYDGLVDKPQPVDMYLTVTKCGRHLRIMIDEDNDLYYEK